MGYVDSHHQNDQPGLEHMNELKDIKEHILPVLKGGDIILIVPPFVTTRTPIIGPHILQAIAREQGYKADILYVNLLLASIIGFDLYESICYGQPFRMLGERLFAGSAYGLPPLGTSPEPCIEPAKSVFGNGRQYPLEEFEYKFYNISDFHLDTFFKMETICKSFIEEVSHTISSLNYKIAGCSTNWEQNNCCIALINRLKKIQPQIVTLIGGSNCEAEMAAGIASLSPSIDHIFSGESELTFADFLKRYAAGNPPSQRIIEGQPLEDLDNIPLPDYDSYFEQLKCFFNDYPLKQVQIGCETSRGCWYGKCYFCGMNGKRGRFRQKTVKKVVTELERVNARYPGHRVLVIDKVMPTSYQEELLPLLYEREDTPPISYEQRPNLEFHELLNIKKAKINLIKPGIEALSTGLLTLMNKGVTASENILLLRNARSLGIWVSWNLLWGFPADRAVFYQETLKILPLIRHLNPPDVFRHISLDRFSAYFEKAKDFAINHLRPWAVYQTVYPDWADLDKLAYRFIGDYPCAAHEHPGLIREIAKEVQTWKKSWGKAKLVMVPFADYYIVYDSRDPGNLKNHMPDFSRSKEIMKYDTYTGSENQEWAVQEKLGVRVDSRYVPLVTASPGLLSGFAQQ